MNFERKSGVLLHITSLPGRWGIGELGPQARNFGRLLAESGQKLWQILPVGPAGYGGSPYSSLSAFAGNHLLISFDELIADGLLSEAGLRRFPRLDAGKIDFTTVTAAREEVLFRVADRFDPDADFARFCEREAHWLADYTLFMALREKHGNGPWTAWPAALRDRDPAAMQTARLRLAKAIRRHEVLQYLFERQWKKFAGFLKEMGVSLIGDIPIFVADDSADVWASRELFFLDETGAPAVVAGVPPDYFSATGQRWGNPLYDWAVHRRSGYAWWTRRMRRLFDLVDIVRIDHFRGFEDYWEIPADEPTAVKGRWVKGPGLDFFRTVESNLRTMPEFGRMFRLDEHVIAENLGMITDEVEALREACGFPGMWVLQFRFGAEPMARPEYRPEGVEKNWSVYTGTHDNDTTHNWYLRMEEAERQRVRTCLHTNGEDIHRALGAMAMHAPAKWAILPLQDVLGLDGGSRMNLPGTTEGNWGWRFSEDMISQDAFRWLRAVTEASGRC